MNTHAMQAGEIPALSDQARRMYRGGIWFLVLAEAIIFVTLFSTRFLLAGTARSVEPGDPVGILITLTLVVSLAPAWLAKRQILAGNAAAMSRHLLVATVLAVFALAVILYDWMTLSFAAGSPFGENYVIVTGYHALHIVIGALWLFAAGIAGRKGIYTRDNHWVVEGGVVFWTSIVAVWILLYVIYFVI
jgi:cytochrome c oxidase subunit 3